MGTIRGQFKQVLLRLGRSPVFTVITLVTLAAGIGANTAVFSVLEGVLLKPLPYPHSERLAAIRLTAPGINVKDFELSPSDYFVFREQSTAFQDIGLYRDDSVSVTGEAQPERVDALIVTDGLLPILGIPPMLGRVFTKADRRTDLWLLASQVRRRGLCNWQDHRGRWKAAPDYWRHAAAVSLPRPFRSCHPYSLPIRPKQNQPR